jgi:DNA-directed RNA polymerase subunit RPC12/RpoP
MGGKCVRCGTEATVNSNGHAVTDPEFHCPSCGYHFPKGDGGATGGMCEPCFDAQLRNAHEEAAKNPAKMSLWAGNSRRKDCEYKTFSQPKEDLAR